MVTQQQIEEAAIIIREGGLVAFPTETVYGLGANTMNPEAVAKIFIEKERPTFNPLISHISSLDDLSLLFRNVDENTLRLAKAFWPGPLTIVSQKSIHVPDIVTSGLPSVAVRMPDNDIALKLIELAACPIAAPSANKFGMLSPTSAEHVRKQLPSLACILDGGSTNIGIESTVISVHHDGFRMLRPGVITRHDLEQVLPYATAPLSNEHRPASPGLLNSHYSPAKPLYIADIQNTITETANAAYLSFTGNEVSGYKMVEYLSHSGDFKEAAINLFGALHRLENADIDFIVAEPVPEIGIGIAIMDRLRKAAYRFSQKITKH